MARRNCDTMIPELPRPAARALSQTAAQTAGRSPPSGSPSTTARSVSDMLVPVSPSGTG